MTIRQTSRDAYKSIFDSLGLRQQSVYCALSTAPMSNAELADYLHRPINCICPRVNELVKMGLVKYAGTKIHPGTHRRQIIWKCVDNPDARQLKFI